MREVREYHKSSAKTILIFGILLSVIALIICGLGIWLVYLNSEGVTKFNILGQEFESNNVGVSSIFIGSIILLFIISKIFKSFDKSSDNYTSSINTIIENKHTESVAFINDDENQDFDKREMTNNDRVAQ